MVNENLQNQEFITENILIDKMHQDSEGKLPKRQPSLRTTLINVI